MKRPKRFSRQMNKHALQTRVTRGRSPWIVSGHYAMRTFSTVALLVLLVGCASAPPKSVVDVERRVDPRLLEQTDEPAPPEAVERAKAFHQASKDAARYPVFQRARILEHGGYSARFGKQTASPACVIYFFDAQGNYLAQDGWRCDGFVPALTRQARNGL